MALTRLARESFTHPTIPIVIQDHLESVVIQIPGEPGECHSPLRDPSFSIALKMECNTDHSISSPSPIVDFHHVRLIVWYKILNPVLTNALGAPVSPIDRFESTTHLNPLDSDSLDP